MKRFFAFVWNVIFTSGVLLPLHSLVMELLTHACAAEFFDPIPTWQHVVLVSLMPVGLALLWVAKNLKRTFTRADAPPAESPQVWDQLARHAVFTEVMAAFQGRDRVPEAQAQKAAQHQLVTPYSGAVVLETQAQYDRVGLKPVDGSTTPQIPPNGAPEHSRTVLLMLGLMSLLGRRRR